MMNHQSRMDSAAVFNEFFKQYAAAALSGNTDAIAQAYLETYIESSPSAVTVYKVDTGYKKALVEKSAGMSRLGLTKLDIAIQSIKEFAPSHYLVDAQWSMQFNPPGKKPASSRFLVSYAVRLERHGPKILASVSHEDEEAVMKRDGVL